MRPGKDQAGRKRLNISVHGADFVVRMLQFCRPQCSELPHYKGLSEKGNGEIAYDSKEALLEDVSRTVRETIAESILSLRNAKNPSEQETIMTGIFRELSLSSTDLVWLVDIGRSLLGHEQIETLVSAKDVKTQYINVACHTAAFGIMTRWLKTGMKESPEEMGKMCCRILRTMRKR